jgi:hypothetical protein
MELQGATHKQIEADSGAHVLLRGRGSGGTEPGDEEDDLHVLIVGETDEHVSQSHIGTDRVARSSDAFACRLPKQRH